MSERTTCNIMQQMINKCCVLLGKNFGSFDRGFTMPSSLYFTKDINKRSATLPVLWLICAVIYIKHNVFLKGYRHKLCGITPLGYALGANAPITDSKREHSLLANTQVLFHMVKSLPPGGKILQKYGPRAEKLSQKPHPRGKFFTFFNTVIVIAALAAFFGKAT